MFFGFIKEGLYVGLPQKGRGLFRGCRVNVKTGTPFKTSNSGELWDDFYVPMKKFFNVVLDGTGMNHEIIGGNVQHLINF
jgi:hypothetical protein